MCTDSQNEARLGCLPADRNICAVRSQDFEHHGAAGGPEGEAAAHWTAAGREGPGEVRGRQGNQPRRRGGAGAGYAEERAGSGELSALDQKIFQKTWKINAWLKQIASMLFLPVYYAW